jgi:glyoxylase-like metal-dependent hydrolase (beta-lactamase superfamily II)
MIKPWTIDQIRRRYPVDKEGYMRLAMNALLVQEGERVVVIDPGVADFLPASLIQEYGLEMPVAIEETLRQADLGVEEITDVIFTHLHFDHGSGAFRRVPGNIGKRFPNARYHVLKEHYRYALHPEGVEANSFSTSFLKRLDQVHWLEDWTCDWMRFEPVQGHTRGMVVPEIRGSEGKIYFASDLLPMEAFLEPEVYSGYDLEPQMLLREKLGFLDLMEQGSQIILYHDPLKDSIFYS